MTERIRKYMNTAWLRDDIIYEEIVDSTNIYAKQIATKNVMNEGVVVAGCQTAGRGRRGHDWVSPKGNCYFSLVLRPSIRPEYAARITLVAALALAKALIKVSGLRVQIKWPNDIVVKGKKLCGILTESSMNANGLEYVIVGVGVNVNQEIFDEAIEDMATSMILQTGEMIDCAQVIAEFLNHFEKVYTSFLQTEDLSTLVELYNQMLVNCNQEVRVIDQGERVAVALGVNEQGELLVRDSKGQIDAIRSGEVSVRGLYGYV